MCIIVYKPKGKVVGRDMLANCFANNPDGAGYMYPAGGKAIIKKGYFTFEDFWREWEKTHKVFSDSLPAVFHFRIATAGELDKVNSHPHRIAPDLAFVHNGILSCVDVPKTSKVSDTIIYRNNFLRQFTGRWIRYDRVFDAIGKHIGKANKFLFMNGAGQVAFCNEEQGIWDGGLWFSNATYKPRTYVYRSWNGKDWYDYYNYCEFCGKELDTEEEREEGLCFACLEYADSLDGVQYCGGCDAPLVTAATREYGWCGTCGHEIYGKEWPDMLKKAASATTDKGAI